MQVWSGDQAGSSHFADNVVRFNPVSFLYRKHRHVPQIGIQAQAVIENYRIWIRQTEWARAFDPDTQSSVLFDTVAVYLAFSEELLVMEDLGIRVTDDGYTVIDESAKVIHCAMDWKDLSAFEDLLVQRLVG